MIPGSGRSPGEGVGYPLQYSGLENPMDCTVCGVAKSRTRLSDFHFTFTRGQSLTVIDALLLLIRMMISSINGVPGGSVSKESACNVGDLGSIPESGRSPGGGNGNPLQHSCLENPMDGGAWQATVHEVAKSQTRLKRFSM